MQKNRIEKIFIYEWGIFRIQSDKIPIGLHGEEGKSNLSDRGLSNTSCSVTALWHHKKIHRIKTCLSMSKRHTISYISGNKPWVIIFLFAPDVWRPPSPKNCRNMRVSVRKTNWKICFSHPSSSFHFASGEPGRVKRSHLTRQHNRKV